MPFTGDPLAFYGKCIVEDYHASLLDKLPSSDRGDPDLFDVSDKALRLFPWKKVGILGAGVGGLYTALILDSLDIEYEIIEASKITGGRLSTYRFSNGKKYDYYDAGAMRFPLPKKDDQGRYKNGAPDPLSSKLIPYYYKAREGSKPGFYYFNGVSQPVSDAPKGPFRAHEMGVDAAYIKATADAISSDVTKPFIRALVQDMKTGTKKGWEVMKANDLYSVRAYMASKYLPSDNLQLLPQHLPNNVINWCGLLGSSSGGYDRALTESVFSSLSFAKVGDTDYGDVEWKCFEGGSETLTKKMEEYINGLQGEKRRIHFCQRVTAIKQHDLIIDIPVGFPKDNLPSDARKTSSDSVDLVVEEDGIVDDPTGHKKRIRIVIPSAAVAVSVNSGQTHVYSHVISTLPLPVLRAIDMRDAGMSVMQKNALRQLQYGPSVKIAVRFKEQWWTKELGIVGGQSFTDLPIRTIVYPSYGVDSDTPSTVLMASLLLDDGRGAPRSACCNERRESAERACASQSRRFWRDNSRRCMSRIGPVTNMRWTDDFFSGAFAYFGPGDFQDLYTSLSFPAANKRLHFAGEALSTRHGWVVGALDSAWRAVYEYLKVTKQDEKMKLFKELWGENAEWSSKSTLAKTDPGVQLDLLDEHLGLINGAVGTGDFEYYY
ncbi:hypothetical protein F5I97DRAFT_1830693 [Phlebopus sp. FC_14]|nr:hypothetical protein F5I97DRAFT_1830693 [Phlebopus sp. FC_14]